VVTGLPADRFAVRAAEALCGGLLREVRPGQWSFRHATGRHRPTVCLTPPR
jgi:hypothetical protein